MSCECGLSYVSGDPSEELIHATWHREYLEGLPVPALAANIAALSRTHGHPVVKIDAQTSDTIRREAAKVAMIAHRATPDFPAGYDGSLTDEGQSLYILLEEATAIGMILVSRGDRCWHLRWLASGKACLISRNASQDTRTIVARLWVAKKYQRQGLATGLLQCVVSDTGIPINEFGWQIPFTEAGTALVRRILPGDWWADGDRFALDDVLDGSENCS
jgi:hypothetical protein